MHNILLIIVFTRQSQVKKEAVDNQNYKDWFTAMDKFKAANLQKLNECEQYKSIDCCFSSYASYANNRIEKMIAKLSDKVDVSQMFWIFVI